MATHRTGGFRSKGGNTMMNEERKVRVALGRRSSRSVASPGGRRRRGRRQAGPSLNPKAILK